MDLKPHGEGLGITLDGGELEKCLPQRSMIQLSFNKENLDSITDHGFEGSKELLMPFFMAFVSIQIQNPLYC